MPQSLDDTIDKLFQLPPDLASEGWFIRYIEYFPTHRWFISLWCYAPDKSYIKSACAFADQLYPAFTIAISLCPFANYTLLSPNLRPPPDQLCLPFEDINYNSIYEHNYIHHATETPSNTMQSIINAILEKSSPIQPATPFVRRV